jgi:two-component system response regulator
MKHLTRILIVEDNPDDEALVLRELKKANMADHLMVIRDGAEALSFISDKIFDGEDIAAVFLDLKLPKISGLKILETIRKQERTKQLAVIVMTSSNSPEELEKCRQLGVSSYVCKPLTFSSFAKAFADSFQEKRSHLA